MSTPSLDCRTCAACCHGGDWVPVEITDNVPEKLTRFGDEFYSNFMRMRCCALRGKTKFSCTIYKIRPAACRDFEVGGEECRKARLDMYEK